ncbi:hypothetical protein ACTWQE_12855, partial [Streptomyces sp. 8N706]
MGRHSRRGRTEAVDTTEITAQPADPPGGAAASHPAAEGRRRGGEPEGRPYGAPAPGFSTGGGTGSFPRPQALSGTPPYGVPQMPPARGGHPEHRERGGGWGTPPPADTPPRGVPVRGARNPGAGSARPTPPQGVPAYGRGQRTPGDPAGATSGPAAGRAQGLAAGPGGAVRPGSAGPGGRPGQPFTTGSAAGLVPRPRQEYIDAFDDDVFPVGAPAPQGGAEAGQPVTAPDGGDEPPADGRQPGAHGKGKGGKGRTFAGVG